MCGLFGFFKKGHPDAKSMDIAKAMLRGLHHRGPDQQAIQSITTPTGILHLGHTRLAILDVTQGRQPMTSQNQQNVIVYNGEVYNTTELKGLLQQHQGPSLRTTCDTEAVLELMSLISPIEALSYFNGMFALAIWDAKHDQLVLARDRFGIKPLFYHLTHTGELIFSSELKNLLVHPAVPRSFEREGLEQYFFQGHTHAPLTVLKGVFQLQPGEMLVWQRANGTITLQRFHQRASASTTATPLTLTDAKSILRKKIATAVKSQMVSDVPLGMFLSGGIDSSVIAYEASRLGPIKTFAMAFEDPTFNESSHAQKMAIKLGSHHHEFLVNNDLMQKHLEQILNSIQCPFADYSVIPSWLLSYYTRAHVTVALGGDGGDELLGGYPTYKAHRLMKPIPSWMARGLAPLVMALPRMDSYQSLEWKLKRLLGRYRVQMPWRHLNWMSLVDESELSGLFEGPLPPTKTGWANLFDLHHIQENLNDMLYLDRVNYMPGEVLTKVDTASMAHSLEVRPPFLDNDLAAWCDQLPIDWKVHGTQGKWLLKESYRGLIPDDILFRPKHGFSVPLAQWMMGPLVKWCHEALADRSFFAQTGLRRQSFQQRFDRHARGLNDCARELWALIVLQRWGRQSGVIC